MQERRENKIKKAKKQIKMGKERKDEKGERRKKRREIENKGKSKRSEKINTHTKNPLFKSGFLFYAFY